MKKHAFYLTLTLLVTLVLAPLYAQEAKRTGEITKIDAAAKSFMVKTARGESNVMTTDATVYKEGDKMIKMADLKVGDHVTVTGERKGNDVEAKEVVREVH